PTAVRQGDRVVEIVRAKDAHDRSEDLIASQERVRGNRVEDGRPDKATVRPRGHRKATPIEYQARAVAGAAPAGVEDASPLFFVDDRAEGGRLVQAIAGL